jgi:hypothetical protein
MENGRKHTGTSSCDDEGDWGSMGLEKHRSRRPTSLKLASAENAQSGGLNDNDRDREKLLRCSKVQGFETAHILRARSINPFLNLYVVTQRKSRAYMHLLTSAITEH